MAVTTYSFPVAGVTAPTATQMADRNMLVCSVAIALYDTTITITHNMNLSVAEIAAGWPKVTLEPDTLAATQERAFVSSVTTNTVVLTVTDFGVGTISAVLNVKLERPASFTK